MTPEIVSFFVLAVASTIAALGVITFKNAVYSALSLIMTLLFVALFYALLQAMFIAIVQVLIYAGAIMVLFLFVVTMLAPDQTNTPDRLGWQKIAGGVLGLVLVGALSYLIFTGAQVTGLHASAAESLSRASQNGALSTEAFGNALFHGYLFPFEVTSLLIIIAILGALVFGRRS
ncbi:NADH-quinone oxidoreductase subunit J family protein [Tengunoibacter tsumagoiensis]|uniref:NADH-quinone oxidoreductase subunit J n=1 Tax=Tengunoibacter tsumagoiensis TaxID=2014871 RepID=A0A401ZV22_9CHLR|nr:NADH-quinone oxidoreductase subunit J [Tengunoibacter tsumagoiensis]GCE10733.1 NADH-quinone oxidoreductase subunit J [Tengunoibacter tsumagoiensis]